MPMGTTYKYLNEGFEEIPDDKILILIQKYTALENPEI